MDGTKENVPPPSTKARGVPDHQRDIALGPGLLWASNRSLAWGGSRGEKKKKASPSEIEFGGGGGNLDRPPGCAKLLLPLFSRLGWVGWERCNRPRQMTTKSLSPYRAPRVYFLIRVPMVAHLVSFQIPDSLAGPDSGERGKCNACARA